MRSAIKSRPENHRCTSGASRARTRAASKPRTNCAGASRRDQCFQGGIEGVVSKEMLENKQAAIDAAVAHIFTKYPFRAGESAPVAPVEEKEKK